MNVLPFMLLFVVGVDAPNSGEYVFVPKLDEVVRIRHGRTNSFGNLDRHGDFVPDPNWTSFDPTRILSVPFRYRRLNPSRGIDPPEKVYEFRSGRLIPGEIDKHDGRFIPDLEGKIIAFKEYKYVPNKSRRIYNLPGTFVRKK